MNNKHYIHENGITEAYETFAPEAGAMAILTAPGREKFLPVKVKEVLDNGAIIVEPINNKFSIAVTGNDLIIVSSSLEEGHAI